MSAEREELPAVSRRRVRLALRAARERVGSTINDVADSLNWSRSKLQRIELGEVSITPTDLRAILTHYRVTDEERISALVEDAHVARRERYWVDPVHRRHLTPGLVQLLQFELAATTIREYQPTMVAGYLQTAETAEATLAWSGFDLAEEARRVRREVRLARRTKVIERGGAPDYLLLLDESALWRMIGDKASMAAQFEDLVETMSRPNVRVRVVPMDVGAVVAMFGSFSIMHLGGEKTASAEVASAETASGAESGGAEASGAEAGGAETANAEAGGAEVGGAETAGGAEAGGAGTGGAGTVSAAAGGAEVGGVAGGGGDGSGGDDSTGSGGGGGDGDEPQDAVLYRESFTRDDLVEEWSEVRFHLDVFERFWDEALGEEASRALILARAYDLRAQIARAAAAPGRGQGRES
ncbi:Scr1 family TA system antitoxin-like transcriptional regulator [Actinoplanes couchii]|uniref:HTH cro/C1-type domain-containing protein n=1 Tax=Actinoplanes couchii TaxID=403638 RepID=A0ABQ3X0W8_9ACTN|nr:Scr1 family TA system antitoxin-like transcriptional regulator [Actinoplanes couchii]MDR6316533.1 transcriptional regulator with XRE-family HTH domain [Actinoplanes couchii]GID52147.1 hypothetical protein Aco03nite_005510 [Actinoplanes couchii]